MSCHGWFVWKYKNSVIYIFSNFAYFLPTFSKLHRKLCSVTHTKKIKIAIQEMMIVQEWKPIEYMELWTFKKKCIFKTQNHQQHASWCPFNLQKPNRGDE